MLSGRQKRYTGEDVGVPQGDLAGLYRLTDQSLPDVVFQEEIA